VLNRISRGRPAIVAGEFSVVIAKI